MLSSACFLQAFLLSLVCDARAHGMMTFPRPRNAADGDLQPWAGWSFPCTRPWPSVSSKSTSSKSSSSTIPTMCSEQFCRHLKRATPTQQDCVHQDCAKDWHWMCPMPSHNGAVGTLDARAGQACYWFSQGCTLGCSRCDGLVSRLGHGMQRFRYRVGQRFLSAAAIRETLPSSTLEPWAPMHGDMVLDPATTRQLDIKPHCAFPSSNATICDPRLRTVNTHAACGSAEDIYYWSPWRAPGLAPILDACGSAGGRYPGFSLTTFQNSSAARQGDLGSQLPPMPPMARWHPGARVEVGWSIFANHGGGCAQP